ncbi:MAG: bifunctional UDP-sugar hydrolase/5'-nucleotidase, partial [Cyclonatronaceae bacterium]
MKSTCFAIFVLITAVATSEAQQGTSPLHFTILHTNDEHSHLIAHPAGDYKPDSENPAVGGFARLAGAIGIIRGQKEEAGEPVLLFSGGDIIGGPAFGWLALRDQAPELLLMQALGYDGITVGNHEYDYNTDVLARYLAAAGYPEAHEHTPLLATNTVIPDNHPASRADLQQIHIKTLENGLRVGYFGLIGYDAIRVTAFTDPFGFEDPIETARLAVAELQAEGVDVIVAITHAGEGEDAEMAREVPGIHVIVGGHTHVPLHEPVMEGNTVIVQAGSELRYLGMLELSYDRDEDRVYIRNGENGTPFLKKLDHTVPEDPEIAEMVASYERMLNDMVAGLTNGLVTDVRQTVAASDFTLPRGPQKTETALGNFITDAMRIIGEEATGHKVDMAVQANGVIRADLVPGQTPWSEGEITFYDLIVTTGLGAGLDGNPGYPMVSVYLTEDEVRRAMEISVLLSELLSNTYYLQYSGTRLVYDPDRAILMRVPFVGTPLPTSRAILSAERYTGEGVQQGDSFEPLNKGGNRLFHIITDYYIAGFLPMVGDMLPNLALVLRDENGNPANLDERIIMNNGDELKVWQAVLTYAMDLDTGSGALPEIPEYYRVSDQRLIIRTTLPLWVWPLVGLVVLTGVLVWFIRRRRRRKKAQ